MKYAVNGTTVAANGTVYHSGDKCNEFVCDAGQAGTGHRAQVPYSDFRGWLFGMTRDPSAKEWATVAIPGYSSPLPLSSVSPGDVIAMAHHDDRDGHVGIYVGNGMTASANANFGGKITVNNWGFRGPVRTVNTQATPVWWSESG
jgi:cell wall-associated NlpC family hydrolase